MASSEIILEAVSSVSQIPAADWDACANPRPGPGGRYYPKLQVSVPFTPATGPRLLIREGVDHERIRSALASGLVALCGMTKASSVHVTFAREAEWKFLAAQGFLQRNDQQFHW